MDAEGSLGSCLNRIFVGLSMQRYSFPVFKRVVVRVGRDQDASFFETRHSLQLLKRNMVFLGVQLLCNTYFRCLSSIFHRRGFFSFLRPCQ